jgi:hypothetical protein
VIAGADQGAVPGQLTGEYPLVAEAVTAIPGDSGALLELLRSLRIDTQPPIEQVAAAHPKSDAALAVEIMRVARGDAQVAGESWGTYVVGVTPTLSDGRVITFPCARDDPIIILRGQR